jgi:hypothetical protein
VSSANIDLHQRLSDLQAKMLEIAHVPSSERKQLVRDVLMDREEEVAKGRREIRSLREQIVRLEMALLNPLTLDGKSNGIEIDQKRGMRDKGRKSRAVGRGGGRGKGVKEEKRGSEAREREMTYTSPEDIDNFEDHGEGDYSDDWAERERGGGGERGGAGMRRRDELSKEEAMQIVIQELRTLQKKCTGLERERTRLAEQVMASRGDFYEQHIIS